MQAAALSHWIEQVTQPKHPLYHPVQGFLFGSCTYIGTAYLTSIPPRKGMLFAVLAYTLSQLTASFFAEFLEPYQEISLVPLIGQVMHLTTSLILAKTICSILKEPLTFKEMRQISFVFLGSLYVMRFALRKFRQHLAYHAKEAYIK